MMATYINSIGLIDSMATTISISKELKDKIAHLGKAGESYEDVIRRMYDFTKRNLLLEWLHDEDECLTPKEALARLERYHQNGKSTHY